LQSRNVIERFEATGVVVGGGTPEQFAELIRSETAKWAKVIKAAGIKTQ
jgi:tripartite-type tricarboxylate transporter receptor subunit TctC